MSAASSASSIIPATSGSSFTGSNLIAAVPPTFWVDRWQLNQTAWHKTEVNADLRRYSPLFQQHFNAIHPTSAASLAIRRPRVLVPLCGKTLDLLHLYHEGYEVVGVEYVEKPILDFFAEHTNTFASFQRKKINDSTELFSSPDERLHIFRADFFAEQLVPLLGTIDFVWDRAALVAIGFAAETRRKYLSQIYRILQHNYSSSSTLSSTSSATACVSAGVLLPHILLETFCYDQEIDIGPPFSQSDAQVVYLFSHLVDGDNEFKAEEFPFSAGEKFKELGAINEIKEISKKDAKKKVYLQLLSDYPFPDEKKRFHGPTYVRLYSIQFV